jgi:hypothetical protein
MQQSVSCVDTPIVYTVKRIFEQQEVSGQTCIGKLVDLQAKTCCAVKKWLNAVGCSISKSPLSLGHKHVLGQSSLEANPATCLITLSNFSGVLEMNHRYDEAPVDQKPYKQKDGALLAVGALSDKLKQTEPYKSQLEHMLVQHVYPEFSSHVGHLRAKVPSQVSKVMAL